MNQEVPPGDIVFGIVVLIIFIIGALIVGRFLSAAKNKRFAAAWAPLIPLIRSGTVHTDGGGAATSWLTGTIQGKQVQASMIPGRNRYSESSDKYNYFAVALLGVPGQEDWRIVYQTATLGIGHTGWHISTKDQTLATRLHDSGVMAALAHLGSPTIEYTVRSGQLQYSEDVTPRWVPTPERFQTALDLLLQIAAISADLTRT